MDNLLEAWREFLRGKRRRKDVTKFSLHLTDNILKLCQELSDKTYHHGSYHAFKVNDPKPRDIHKASVRDRLVHHALHRVLYPPFDRLLIHEAYSCRHEKGVHRAINRFRAFARIVSRNHTRTVSVLTCDIRKFFASIDHATLLRLIERDVRDADVRWLINRIVASFCTKDRPGVGLPLASGVQNSFQGSALS